MSVHDEDVKTLLNDLIDRYGYDFTGYAEASLKRRINRLFELDRFPSFAEFRFRILNDAEYFRRLVEAVQRRGLRVSVVSTVRSSPPMVADELRRQADHFIELDEIANMISRQNARPAASNGDSGGHHVESRS